MYAVIETGGKQYQVKQGDVVFIEKLNAEEESTVTFDKVVAVSKEDGLTVGAPYVAGATVSAKVLTSQRSPKRRSRVTDSRIPRYRSKPSRRKSPVS